MVDLLAVCGPAAIATLLGVLGVSLWMRNKNGLSKAAWFYVLFIFAVQVVLFRLTYEQATRFTSLTFEGGRVEAVSPFFRKVLECNAGSEVRKSLTFITLRSGRDAVVLPVAGCWKFGDMEVDAEYLAREYIGRARARGRRGDLATIGTIGRYQATSR